MKVKVKTYEFTYQDQKGYRTIVSVGTVPVNHPQIQSAIKAGVLVPIVTSEAETSSKKEKK